MNVYLAARYSRRDEIAAYAQELEALGYTVNASWLHTTDAQELQARGQSWYAASQARADLQEIDRAGLFIVFSEGPDEAHPGGGRHVELGYALSKNAYQRTLGQRPIRIVVVGPRQTIFHSLDVIERFETWQEAIEEFRREAEQWQG